MSDNVATILEARLRRQQPRSSDYNHWDLHLDANNVLWLGLDKQDSSTNTLNADVLEELSRILDAMNDSAPKAVVLRSLKPAGFCAGADIKQFTDYDAQQIRDLLREGHGILDRLEKLASPTIAVVHGHCLGGGLELALACKYRIGLKGSLEMGFPEILLGLHPGLGGTFRLTGLIDPVAAMTMMLTGKSAYGQQALRHRLVDVLVEERNLDNAVAAAANGNIKRQGQSLKAKLFNTSAVRKLASRRMRMQAQKRAPERDYPAPSALITLWREHGNNRDAMQQAEMDSFANLLDGDTSKNLVRVFFLRESLKQAAGADTAISHVHVIGAGAMGGDIAAWCAMKGCRVTLSDVKLESIASGVKSVKDLCRSRHKSNIDTRDTYDRLIPDPQMQGIARADLVIEAVPENADLKQKIYQEVEPRLKPGAILATNTSSIPLHKLASFLENPGRFVGLHFFNPVAKMLIVEVVSRPNLDKGVRAQVAAFVRAIGKLPVSVQSYPGFLVNRALTPYLLEAMVLLDEGVDKHRIDQAAVDFGMPMGPVELADQVGLDICLHVGGVLSESLDTPMAPVPDWLRTKVERGELGRKSGQGFYAWKNGRAQKKDKKEHGDSAALADRLLLPMLNACVECYRKQVVSDPDHLDAAMIFATGFAPFRGGPLHYAQSRGIADIIQALEALTAKHGARFQPDPGWHDLK